MAWWSAVERGSRPHSPSEKRTVPECPVQLEASGEAIHGLPEHTPGLRGRFAETIANSIVDPGVRAHTLLAAAAAAARAGDHDHFAALLRDAEADARSASTQMRGLPRRSPARSPALTTRSG